MGPQDQRADPPMPSLHTQPRFQSLVGQYQHIVAKQRALLAVMRSKGEVPWRPASAAAAIRPP
jgi:hypothetical protein